VLGDELRLEAAVAIARNLDGELAEFTLECLFAFAVAGVARRIGDGFILAVTKMRFHLGIQRTFDQCLGELLEQAVLAYQVFRFLVVSQQAVDQFLR